MLLSAVIPLLCALCLQQAAAESEVTDPREAQLPEWSRGEATAIVAEYRPALRKKKPEERMQALRQMATGRHEEISKALKAALSDRDENVRLLVVQLLGTQRDDVARKMLMQLATPGRSFKPFYCEEAVRSLGYSGYGKGGYEQLDRLFWERPAKEIRRAVVQTFGRQGEKRAVSLLITLIDQPGPKDPADPNNPPASYWAEKYTEWIHYKDDVIVALEQITGQKFYNSETALHWMENEGKKNGFRLIDQRKPW